VGTYGFHEWIVDDRSDPRIAREEQLVQTCARECRDLSETFDERGIHKFLLMGESRDILVAQEMISERFPHLTAVRSSDILCEVMAGDVRKGQAVRLLCEHYGIDSREAVAFGDGPNDIDMLQAVERSYAMANAEEEVKQAAFEVVPWTNAESGVAKMLERLVLA
jgi:HAD superfamily hydrolase (TIGR01484 family)